jgi:hypothetical protein
VDGFADDFCMADDFLNEINHFDGTHEELSASQTQVHGHRDNIPDDELLIVEYGYLWPNGSTLNVAFTADSVDTNGAKAKVKEWATEWTQYANIKFNFADVAWNDTDILILLNKSENNENGVNWSLLGNLSRT